jgi:DNA-binding response OmpR family regulator
LNMTRLRPRILLLEDSPDVRLIVESTLSDFDLTSVTTLAEANAAISKPDFNLYILDITLPDGTSFEFCKALRAKPGGESCAVLFLSGKSAEVDRLTAFKFGADDYIQKPFSALELKARVMARLRSLKMDESPRVLRFPTLSVDIEKKRVEIKEGNFSVPVKLTKIEFGLLVALCKKPEVVKSRQMLLDEVWGNSISVSERSVDVHIYNLRRKLGAFAGLIESNAGNGYCFLPHAQKVS